MKRFAAIIVFLAACQDPCYYNNYSNVTDYAVSPDEQTPGGIKVMTNGNEVDLLAVDSLTDYVEECLGVAVKRECITVIVPPDWYDSACSDEQLFPCRVNPQVCADKGLEINPKCEPGQAPNEECPCPCNCRATIQDENVIVTTPNLKLYSAELIRMVTGINNIWINEETKQCYVNPSDL